MPAAPDSTAVLVDASDGSPIRKGLQSLTQHTDVVGVSQCFPCVCACAPAKLPVEEWEVLPHIINGALAVQHRVASVFTECVSHGRDVEQVCLPGILCPAAREGQ